MAKRWGGEGATIFCCAVRPPSIRSLLPMPQKNGSYRLFKKYLPQPKYYGRVLAIPLHGIISGNVVFDVPKQHVIHMTGLKFIAHSRGRCLYMSQKGNGLPTASFGLLP